MSGIMVVRFATALLARYIPLLPCLITWIGGILKG